MPSPRRHEFCAVIQRVMLRRVTLGTGLPQLDGYPFEVRYSEGALARAHAAADIASDAYGYFNRLFAVEPDIAVIVASEADWKSRQPYGLPFFNDDEGQIRPGIVVMPAGSGDFWVGIGEIFANLVLHAFVATKRPESLSTLETLSSVGAGSRRLAAQWHAEGYTTLEELEAHYTGGDQPMSALNYVWYQYRWQRLAARMFEADGEDGLIRFWDCFHTAGFPSPDQVTTSSLARLLRTDVSQTLGRAIQSWR